MSYTKPKVTIDLDEYTDLLKSDAIAEDRVKRKDAEMEKLHLRSREFVSALAFIESKGLLDEFNKKINKSYKLESVGINKDYKKLIES